MQWCYRDEDSETRLPAPPPQPQSRLSACFRDSLQHLQIWLKTWGKHYWLTAPHLGAIMDNTHQALALLADSPPDAQERQQEYHAVRDECPHGGQRRQDSTQTSPLLALYFSASYEEWI